MEEKIQKLYTLTYLDSLLSLTIRTPYVSTSVYSDMFAAMGNMLSSYMYTLEDVEKNIYPDSIDTVEHNLTKDSAMIRTKDHLYEWTVRATNLK